MYARGLTTYSPAMLSILRIITGLLFLAHGTQKFLHFPAGERAGSGWALDNLGAVAGIIELITKNPSLAPQYGPFGRCLQASQTAGLYWPMRCCATLY